MQTIKKNIRDIFPLLILISGFVLLFSSHCQAGGMIWPLSGPITSEFGWRTHPIFGTTRYHSGIDIGGDYGLPIQAAAAGTVTYAGEISGYGNAVIIDHGGGITTLYGHNDSLVVGEGQVVGQGQVIAWCGSTGNSTGPHCHFEVRENGEPVSPYGYLDGTMPPYGGTDFFKSDFNFLPMDFSAANDIAKPMKEETDAIVEACLKAMKILKEKLAGLLIILMTIDLALAAIWQMFKTYYDPATGQPKTSLRGFINWLMRRLVFYGMLVFIFNNWSEYYANMIMDLFTGLGGVASDNTPEEVGNMLSDVTDLVQHGVSLLSPFFNTVANQPLSMFFHNPVSIAVALLLVVLIILGWMIIGMGISMAYVEFYVVAVFSFTMFCFNGLEQLRVYGSKSISAVMVCGIQVFFYSIFVALLTLMCKQLAVSYVDGHTINIMPMFGTLGLQAVFILFCERMHRTITDIFNVKSDFKIRAFSRENLTHL